LLVGNVYSYIYASTDLISHNLSIVTTLLSNEQLIPAVVGAMFKFPDRASLQGAAIDILSNIALDNFLRWDVCQRGGTSRIISALDNPKLKQDPTVVCKAFAALSNLISGASVEVLQNQDLPAPKIFVQAMAAHPQNLPIQVGGAYALCKSKYRHVCVLKKVFSLVSFFLIFTCSLS